MDWLTHAVSAVVGAVVTMAGAWVAVMRSRRTNAASERSQDRADIKLHRTEDRADYSRLFEQQTALITGMQSQITQLRDELKELRQEHTSCREESAAQRAEIASLKARVAALEAENSELKKAKPS